MRIKCALNFSCFVTVSWSVIHNHISTWQKEVTVYFFLKADIIGCKSRRQCFLKLGRADSEYRKSCSMSDIFKLNLKCIYFSLVREYEGGVGLITTVLITVTECQLITMCRNQMSN